jgi:hypothetical protein
MRSSWRHLRVAIPRLAPDLLALELLSQLTFEASFFSRLHVKGVFLNFLDNAFLLNLALEAPKGALNGLTFEHSNSGQSMPPRYLRSSREYEGPCLTKQHVFLIRRRFVTQKDRVAGAALLQASADALHLDPKPNITKALFEFSIFPGRPNSQHSAGLESRMSGG